MAGTGRRILAAVDGSDQSKELVKYLGLMFGSQPVKVVLFHVFSPRPESFWDIALDYPDLDLTDTERSQPVLQKERINRFMEESRRGLIEAGLPEGAIEIKVADRLKGIARDIIAEAPKDYEAVVFGRTGAGGLPGLVLGGVANKLLTKLNGVHLGVISGKPRSKKILAGLDGSEGSRRAVEWLASFGESSGWEVMLFHVLRRSAYTLDGEALPDKTWVVSGQKVMDPVLAEGKKRLLASGSKEEQIKIKMVTEAHSRAGAMIEEALGGEYSTIVVGRRGVSRVREFIMGRVGNKLIQLAQDMAVWIIH